MPPCRPTSLVRGVVVRSVLPRLRLVGLPASPKGAEGTDLRCSVLRRRPQTCKGSCVNQETFTAVGRYSGTPSLVEGGGEILGAIRTGHFAWKLYRGPASQYLQHHGDDVSFLGGLLFEGQRSPQDSTPLSTIWSSGTVPLRSLAGRRRHARAIPGPSR